MTQEQYDFLRESIRILEDELFIVHVDDNPRNFMRRSDGLPRIIDWGSACSQDTDPAKFERALNAREGGGGGAANMKEIFRVR